MNFMMVTGCKNPCHHSGGSAADYYNFAHGIFSCIYFTLQIVYFIMVPRLRFATINIDMYHWHHIPIGTLYSRVSYSSIITQRSLLTQAPFFVWTYLITDQLYRICSVLFVSCFLVNFCFLSLTVFEEVHSYLWEQCVC